MTQNNSREEGDTTKFHKLADLSDGRTKRIENDVGEIKDNVKIIMEGLFGSIHDGEPKVGLYEDVRIAKYDIRKLKEEREVIKSINQSIDSLNKWKYYIIGGFIVFVALIDRAIHWIASFMPQK